LTLPWLIAGYVLGGIAVAYQGVVLWALWRWFRRRAMPAGGEAPVTVLKPLSGDDPELYDNLRSFCEQDHPCFQIIFGMASADDPAMEAVRRLRAEFPQLDIATVCAPQTGAENLKVANLMNMLPRAHHDRLVLADSDIRVGPRYLRVVTAPLDDPATGVVTCLYRGRAPSGLWSRLEALFINDWFLPSVLVSHAFGSRAFAFGPTIALRRDVLARIGGLSALADELADDYRLGEFTRRAGFATALSPYLVEALTAEPTLRSLWLHQIRWARTIKVLQPLGYTFSFLTYSLPLAVAGALCADASGGALILLGITVIGRVVLHYAVNGWSRGWPANLILIAARDFFGLSVWFASFFGRTVFWQGRRLSLRRDGSMREQR
jgi:ceramide glucosyltransferase